ncbi:hypothetical protein KDW_15550 [Dictyobacter vulcani]|uniref:Erythromycin esterase n=1 Tax=Dictyobacter vulcani TaxID=2607529 RepID=A0A5J4KI34_9CHLR|nr:erythromycin esterase family protein [Dictyobacter vulcani]GER87393.1 hypothetical protein KDW_15550 [Dictyobacter vulcani]
MQEQHVTRLEEVIEWLKDYAIAFGSTLPGGNNRDLLPFVDIVGSARIVSCGEATRGTHEFFTLTHRLLEILVTEAGFTHFALEDGWDEAERINTFIRTGQGDPVSLVNGLRSWTWKTQEMLDIILWMRAYNQGRGSRPELQFCGIDMQSCDLAMQNVLDYVAKVDPDAVEEIGQLYETFWTYADHLGRYSDEPLSVKQTCWLQLQRVFDLLHQRRPIYERQSSAAEFAAALQSARIVLQAEEMFATYNYEQRDEFMAENVSWLLEQAGPEAKMFIWTHNGHAAAPMGNVERRFMGTYLSERYQEEFLAVGMLFYQGACNALDREKPQQPVPHLVVLPPQDSYEYAFHATGLGHMMIDMQGFPDEEQRSAWLLQPHLHRTIGAMYAAEQDKLHWSPIELAYEFDLIFYLNESTPSRLLHSDNEVDEDTRTASRLISLQPRNLMFESGLAYWLYNAPITHECGIETVFAHSGEACAYLKSSDPDPTVFSTMHQIIAASAYLQHRIRLSAYVKAQQVQKYAGLWMRIESPDGALKFDGMANRAIGGTSDWKRYEIVLDVPEGSTQIVFGLHLGGRGQVWLDDVQLEVVSDEVPTTDNAF